MAFLITWTTYNSWLPGDPRGFRTRKGREFVPPPERYAENGQRSYDPQRFEKLHLVYAGKDAIKLNSRQWQIAAETIIETIKELSSERAVVCVSETHVHVLIELGGRALVPRFCHLAKGRSSRKLTAAGLAGRVWARGYHARHIDTVSWDSAEKYITGHKTGDEVFRRIQ